MRSQPAKNILLLSGIVLSVTLALWSSVLARSPLEPRPKGMTETGRMSQYLITTDVEAGPAGAREGHRVGQD